MEKPQLLNTLLASDVVIEVNTEQLKLTDEFEDALDGYRQRFEQAGVDEFTAIIEACVPDTIDPEWVVDLLAQNTTLLARYVSLADFLDVDTVSEQTRYLVLLNSILDTDQPSKGVPEPFLSIDGHHLPFYLQLHRVVIVYVWRTGCPECDGMRAELEQATIEEGDDVGRYAIYGPDCARFIEEEYDVVGGPTTLFVRDGTVDSRLQGHFEASAIKTELDKSLALVESS